MLETVAWAVLLMCLGGIVVVVVGLAITEAPVVALKPVAGDHV